MADLLPIDTTSMAQAELTPAAAPYIPSPEELTRRAAAAEHLAQLAAAAGLSPEEYAKTWGRATERHQFLDLDADSVCPLEGACRYPYLNAGGQS